jgi:rifampicin phosphotransferase
VEPVHAQPDLLLVTSNWGLGISVVNGSVPTDTARLRRSDLGIEDLLIGDKSSAIRPAPNGRGVSPVAVSEKLRGVACLPESWLQCVGQFGLACEQVMGAPQDVEWAIAGGELWILQSRPITALPEGIRRATSFPVSWANEAEPRHFWWLVARTDRPGTVNYPAEIDFIRTSSQGGQDAVYFGGSADTRWFKFANGRQYMARAKSGLSPGRVRIHTAARQDLFKRMEQENTTHWDIWGSEIVLATERLAAFDPSTADGPALADHLENTLATSIRHWMVHTLTPRPSHSQSLLEAYAQLIGLGIDQAEKDLPALLAGLETVQTRLIDALYELACLALEDPETAKRIACGQEAALPAGSKLGAFAQAYDRLLGVYGDRLCYRAIPGYPADLPFPWRESPDMVWGMISAYLPLARQADPQPPRQARAAAFQATQARLERLYVSTSDTDQVNKFRHALGYARRNAVFLDEHNHYIDQLSEGQYVQALLHAGRWLAKREKLKYYLEIFWLKVEEILAALNGMPIKLDEICASRRAEFEEWQAMIPPACLGLPNPELGERPEPAAIEMAKELPQTANQANHLVGEPASRGLATGRARVFLNLSTLPQIEPGDILIANYIPTSWTPILPILAGVVLDFGSPGDHPSITAREFGVPVICSTLHATKLIPDGTWVSLDAATGQVIWNVTPTT